MSYKIKTLDLRKEGRNVDKMLSATYHRPLKFISKALFGQLLIVQRVISCYDYSLFDSKEEWEHLCRKNAGHAHKHVMSILKTEMNSDYTRTKFNVINRLIREHYEKEGLKSDLHNEKMYSEIISKNYFK